jgi:hypothetical protein
MPVLGESFCFNLASYTGGLDGKGIRVRERALRRWF